MSSHASNTNLAIALQCSMFGSLYCYSCLPLMELCPSILMTNFQNYCPCSNKKIPLFVRQWYMERTSGQDDNVMSDSKTRKMYFFSFDLKFPAIRFDHMKNFEKSTYLFNKCYFLLLDEKHSNDLKIIIERVIKIFNRYPKFSVILSQAEPGNRIFENKENSPLAFILNDKVNIKI